MAVKWAVANGNWSVGATWNDGVIPTSGDEVYLNGKVVSLYSNEIVNIGNGTIRNDKNDEYGIVQGGYINGYTNHAHSFTANFYNVYDFIFAVESSNMTYNIYGNVYSAHNTAFCRIGSSGGVYWNFVGNVELGTGAILASSQSNFNNASITGNVTLDSASILTGGTRTLTLVGNVTCINGLCGASNTLTLLGNVIGVNMNACLSATDITINGSIAYKSSNPSYLGIKYTGSLVIQNSDTFTWKDVTEPRSNPFIILTDAEMNNRQQYPPEDEVKEGTEYAWGEKVGTYQQPSESVVLKDFVYDNGEKIGVLETTNLSQQLISRLENCATIETVQQLLVAHLDN